jgi:hypothetical protein
MRGPKGDSQTVVSLLFPRSVCNAGCFDGISYPFLTRVALHFVDSRAAAESDGSDMEIDIELKRIEDHDRQSGDVNQRAKPPR